MDIVISLYIIHTSASLYLWKFCHPMQVWQIWFATTSRNPFMKVLFIFLILYSIKLKLFINYWQYYTFKNYNLDFVSNYYDEVINPTDGISPIKNSCTKCLIEMQVNVLIIITTPLLPSGLILAVWDRVTSCLFKLIIAILLLWWSNKKCLHLLTLSSARPFCQ